MQYYERKNKEDFSENDITSVQTWRKRYIKNIRGSDKEDREK